MGRWRGVRHTPLCRSDDYTGRRASTTSRPESDRLDRRRPRRQRRVGRPLDPALRRAGSASGGVPRDGADRLSRRGPGPARRPSSRPPAPPCARSPRGWPTRASASCRSSSATSTAPRRAQPRYGQPAGAPQNAAAVLHRGEVVLTFAKHHLPNYGVFDEFRYFVPGDTLPVDPGARRRRRPRHLRGPLAGRRPRARPPAPPGPGCCSPSTPRRTSATRTTPASSWCASAPRRPAAPPRTSR